LLFSDLNLQVIAFRMILLRFLERIKMIIVFLDEMMQSRRLQLPFQRKKSIPARLNAAVQHVT
jgi:hypothetical protein